MSQSQETEILCSVCEPSVHLTGMCNVAGCDGFRVAESTAFFLLAILVGASYFNLYQRKKKWRSLPQFIIFLLFLVAARNFILVLIVLVRAIRPLVLLGTKSSTQTSQGYLILVDMLFSLPVGFGMMAYTTMAQRWFSESYIH
jgi:hypothetical protein